MKMLKSLRSVMMRSGHRFIWMVTTIGITVLLLVFAAIDYDFYLTARSVNEKIARNVAGLASLNVARNLELYDLSLQSVLEGVTDPDIIYQEPGLRQKILFDRSATASGLGGITVLDEKGRVFLDSLSENPKPEDLSSREYFINHRDTPYDSGLVIGRPTPAGVPDDSMVISVSRRISKPDGSFGGVVAGSIRVGYLESLFNKVSIGPDGSIALLRDDGVLVAHNKTIKAPSGTDWHAAVVFKWLHKKSHGSFMTTHSMDGVPRLYVFQKIENLPLVMVVGIPTSHIFGGWWLKTILLSAVFAIMAGGMLVLVWLLETEIERRAEAEHAAERMARIDGLTKLANRRSFDEELSRCWAQTMRDVQPLSLLMIDVDHFKSFNDTYGHPEGDRVLCAVAAVISGAVKRPTDMAARYGGEEFAVLLPNTDQTGAAQIADGISLAVNRLGIDHSGTDHHGVTVSIGTATVTPRAGASHSNLIRSADLALYRAKNEGRNTIRHHNVVHGDFKPVSRAG